MVEDLKAGTDEGLDESRELISEQPKPNVLKRASCGILLIIWFTALLTPCLLIYLASNGEIRIWHTDIPEPHAHPRLLIELITEVDYRGLRIVNSTITEVRSDDDSLTCIDTNVRYLLWESAEDDQDVAYCDCYQRENSESIWTLTSTSLNSCLPTSD